MSTTTAVPVLTQILDWSRKLPAWQRDALRRIISQPSLLDNDINELTTLCKLAHGLSDPDIPSLSAQHLSEVDLPATPNACRSVTLLTLSHPENVNALCSKQVLTFGPAGLTAVFGYNGSGKSGYGRIVKKACRARRKADITANVFCDSASGPASAEVQFALDGTEQSPEQWIDGVRDIPCLSAVSFFDADCGVAHVADKNAIAFTPFGLDFLPKLGEVCKQGAISLLRPKCGRFSLRLHEIPAQCQGCLAKKGVHPSP